MWEAGFGRDTIARSLGCSPGTVNYHQYTLGLPPRKRSPERTTLIDEMCGLYDHLLVLRWLEKEKNR